MTATIFILLAALAVLGAVLAVLLPNAVHAAMALIVMLVATAGIYLLLSAPFVAVIQIAVYAGAIMVLFLFVIMLMNVELRIPLRRWTLVAGTVAGGLFLYQTVHLLRGVMDDQARSGADGFGSAHEVSSVLFAEYVVPFELVSVLLLVAIVAAVVLGKREAA
ncbi:MAG: NADH-quinone oxidoreductase subunit J [Nitrospirae bacterium]|nr:NADH-quinone oxidoreductase subunit J [Nitrospirota bacterium]